MCIRDSVCALSPAAAAAEAATEFAASGEAGSTVGYVSASASDVLALPRQVEGRPLVRIGVRALPFAPASVVVPETVRKMCIRDRQTVVAELVLRKVRQHGVFDLLLCLTDVHDCSPCELMS